MLFVQFKEGHDHFDTYMFIKGIKHIAPKASLWLFDSCYFANLHIMTTSEQVYVCMFLKSFISRTACCQMDAPCPNYKCPAVASDIHLLVQTNHILAVCLETRLEM